MAAADPIEFSLLPLTSTINEQGHLEIGGCDVVELAHTYGTPLFIYDERHLHARCQEAVAAFDDGVAFASKSFLCRAMASLAASEGLCIDVASGGELAVALAAGVPADRIVFHGNNKSMEELITALEVKVRHIVIDSFDEIDRLERLVSDQAPVSVLVRVTPGVEAHTHEFIQTGQEDSKFGLSVASGAALAAIERLRAIPGVHLAGVHAHIGSQVFDVESFAKAATILAEFFIPLGLEELCVGGGLGVAYVNGEHAATIGEWGSAIRSALKEAGVSDSTVVTAEPGRAIVASAAVTIYRVGTIKRLPDIRTYVAVDGGMSDNPRPILYGSGYEAFDPARVSAPRTETVRVVGKHCESGDVIVPDAQVPEGIAVGDLLATPVTGAYGYSMASNYNRVTRPAVVFVADGTARLVLRRETDADLLTLEVE
jgi:diaminopimelate decarboxylase